MPERAPELRGAVLRGSLLRAGYPSRPIPRMIALTLALVAALGLGMSDYLGGVASRRVPALLVIACTYPLSIALVAALVPLASGHFSWAGFAWGCGSGIATGGAVWTFYEALARGPMAVVSPVAAVISASLPALVGFAQGERPAPLAVVGIVGAVLAAALVSLERAAPSAERRFSPRVAALTVASGVLFALYFVMIGHVPDGEGLWPMVASRSGATAVILCGVVWLALRRRRRGVRGAGVLPAPSGSTMRRLAPLAVTVAILDVISNVAYYYASHLGMLAVVSVVASLYPAATVLAALVHGGERLRVVQGVGLAAAAVSVALITLA